MRFKYKVRTLKLVSTLYLVSVQTISVYVFAQDVEVRKNPDGTIDVIDKEADKVIGASKKNYSRKASYSNKANYSNKAYSKNYGDILVKRNADGTVDIVDQTESRISKAAFSVQSKNFRPKIKQKLVTKTKK